MMKHGRRKRKRKANFFFGGGGQLLAPVGFFSLKHSNSDSFHAPTNVPRGHCGDHQGQRTNACTNAQAHRLHAASFQETEKFNQKSTLHAYCFLGGVRVCNAILTFFFSFFPFSCTHRDL